MNATATAFLLNKYGKKNPPILKSGDTIRVHQRIKEGNKERVQIFEGLVIATKHGKGLDGTFTVRKIGAGAIGVERTYPLHSPNIVKVERIKNAEVSRAKLYYMRDRRGKAARFKNEGPSYMTWDESGHQLSEEEIKAAEETIEEEIAAEEVVAEEEAITEPEVEAAEEEAKVAEAVEAEPAPEQVKEIAEEIKEESQEEKAA